MDKSNNTETSTSKRKKRVLVENVEVGKKKPVKILIISLVSIIFILSLVIALFLTGVIDIDFINKGTCEYMGETYEDGDSFPAEDGCNICTCNGDTGSVFCTEMDCTSTSSNDEQEDEEEENPVWVVSEPELPSDIYEEQVYKEYIINNTKFLIYIRSNMNYHLYDSNGESGILSAEPDDTQWQPFIKVRELGTTKNNFFYFAYDSDINSWVTLLIDASGAGSGEGTAKILSLNQSEDSWELLECFYFIPEHLDLDNISNLRQEVDTYLQNNPQYIKTSSDTHCSNFEIVQG